MNSIPCFIKETGSERKAKFMTTADSSIQGNANSTEEPPLTTLTRTDFFFPQILLRRLYPRFHLSHTVVWAYALDTNRPAFKS